MKRLLYFCCLFGMFLSCKDEQIDIASNHNDELTISSARKWFEEKELSKLRELNVKDEEIIEINWKLASKQKVNKLNDEAIIVPIIKQKKGDLVTLKHLWIYNDKQKNKIARVFEYIYDTKLPKNRIQNLKKFTGAMVFREWNGKFLGGLKINENSIESVISEINYSGIKEKIELPKSPKDRTMNRTMNSTTNCITWDNCRNWTISFGSVAVNGTSCITEFYCYWISTNGIDPAFTGNLIDIPTIPSSVYSSTTGSNGDWPTSPPTSTNFGFAPTLCEGLNIMLQAQSQQNKEIQGAITIDGKVIMFPTAQNTKNTVNFNFPYTATDGQIMMNIVYGNPDPADPQNDGKYQDDDIGIEIVDFSKGKIIYYKIAGIIHSHPIESGYDYNNPSPQDMSQASTWPAKIQNFIINNNKLIGIPTSKHIFTLG
jgi:hypothetical protein